MPIRSLAVLARGLPLTMLVLASAAGSAAAQPDSACTWDRCALRTEAGFFGRRLVRGVDGQRVASLGLFPPALPWLAERSGEAAIRYGAFRRRQGAGMALTLVGFAAQFAGLLMLDSNNDEAAAALLIGGLGLTMGGGFVVTSAQNDLSRAVWWYNRTFTGEDP